jgi:hypothetical protein
MLNSGLLQTEYISTYDKTYEIVGQDINIFNSYLVDQPNIMKTNQSIVLGDGFYSQEIWDKNIAYWCQNSASFSIYNESNTDKKAVLQAIFTAGDNSRTYSLVLAGKDIEETMNISSTSQDISINLILKPGKNDFVFTCDAPPVITTNGDPRTLVFNVVNMNVNYLE